MICHYYIRHGEECDDVDGAYTRLREAKAACNAIVRATGEAHYVARITPDGDSDDIVVYVQHPTTTEAS